MNKNMFFSTAALLCLAAAVFSATPPITNGLVMNFDASALNLNDGDFVAVWPDTSGSGNDATTDSATNMPVYHEVAVNFGRPAVYFDGIDDFLRLPSPAPFSCDSGSAIFYAQYEANGSYAYLMTGQSDGHTDRFRMVKNNQYVFQAGDSPFMRTTYSGSSARTFALTSGGGVVNGYIDDKLLVTGSETTTEVPARLNIGSYGGIKEFFKGHVANAIFYNRSLSTEEVLAVRTFIFQGIPLNMVPADKAEQVLTSTASLSWSAPSVDAPVESYNIVMRTTDPNFIDETNNIVFQNVADLNADEAVVEAAMPIALDYLHTYYWRVDTIAGGQVYEGSVRTFTTAPNDSDPVADAGDSYLTWVDNLPLNIAGSVFEDGEGDVADANVQWSISAYPGDPTAAAEQLMFRGMTSQAAADLKLLGYDPNTLAEWIGTDTRQPGNPLSITLSGLPAGTYTWTSLHHDYQDQRGTFNVYIGDVLVGENITISTASATPTQFATQFTTDGSDVVIIFDKNVDADTSDWYKFFAMNAFTLTDGISTINVDFDNLTSTTAADYVSYKAEHEVPGSFTAQSFAFGPSTLTILPQWGPYAAGRVEGAEVVKTSTDPLAPTAAFSTLTPGTYTITLTATDNAGHSSTDTMSVQVLADSCAAAQVMTGWTGFNYYDADQNCVIDILDLASFATSWLNDVSASASIQY